MLKLISAETKRFMISPHYIFVVFLLLWIHITRKRQGNLPFISWGDDFLDNTIILVIFLSLIISMYLYEEFSNRTIYSKLISGYSKRQIFVAETLSCGIGSGILLVIDTGFCIIKKRMIHHVLELSPTSVFVNTLIFMTAIGCISIIISSFSLVVRKKILTPVMLVLIAVVLISHGRKINGTLTGAESIFVETESQNDADSIDAMNHALELTEEGRRFSNAIVMLSPYAQTQYATYILAERAEDKPRLSFLFPNNPFHIDFMIANILLSALVITLFMNIFRKQNL